ncbi:MAG TPA: hypothetical protein VE953_14995 [Terriglobales bacterium]|nr:hypothetical protein [Terriglobales bacterium]
MPESNHLPEHLRARLARGLDAVPELRPRPEQATYARRRYRAARRPALALLSGASALIALAALAGLASTGSANPVVWTGRAISEIHPAEPTPSPATEPTTPPAAAPGAGASGQQVRRVGPTAVRPSPPPDDRFLPTIPPGFLPTSDPRLPRFSPRPFPTDFPFPTPPNTSDFGHGGR